LNYVYDAVGDVTNDGVRSYHYDGESRLVKVDSGATAINTYDAANRRVKKQTAAGTTWYVWEGGVVIAEYGAAQGSGGIRYYHPDRLSTRMITNSTGGVAGTQDHLPFGEDAGVTGESEKHRFTNYERDLESGTDYAVNRQYSTATGRFMRPDPVGGSIGNPQSQNLYSYVGNDPINSVDPLGLLTICFWRIERQPTFEIINREIIPTGTREVLVSEGCIDLPDFGLLTEPGRPNAVREVADKQKMKGPDKALPSCSDINIVLSPNKCAEYAALIKEYTDSVSQRFDELVPSSDTYGSHRDRINRERQELNNCIQKYKDECGDNKRVPPGFDLNEAEEQARRRFPAPGSAKEFVDRGGLVPVLIAICAVCPACCAGGARAPKPVPARP